MLFWFGLVLALLAGLMSIGFSRESVKRRYPAVGDYHLDRLALAALIVGLGVSAVDHLHSERSLGTFNTKQSKAETEVEELRRQQQPRSAALSNGDLRKFLKGKATAKAAIWYLRDDQESWQFAGSLSGELMEAGWYIGEGEVQPIPSDAVDIELRDKDGFVLQRIPLQFRAGGSYASITVLSRSPWDESGPAGVLIHGLKLLGLGVSGWPKSDLKADNVLIIIDKKP